MMDQELFDLFHTAYDINEYTVSGKIQQVVRVISFCASITFFILTKIGLYPLVSCILGFVCIAVWCVFKIVHIIQTIREWKDTLYDGKIQWNAIAQVVCVYSFSAAIAFFVLAKINFYPLVSFILGLVSVAVLCVSLIVHIIQVIREWRELYHYEK